MIVKSNNKLYNVFKQNEESMSNNTQILILDNDLSCLTTLERILHSLGEVICFNNALDFMNHLKNKPTPGIILIDTNSHGFNGYEVLSKIHSLSILSDTPILLTIKEGSIKDESTIQLSGAHDYLFKPYQLSIVQNRVKSYLELDRKSVV